MIYLHVHKSGVEIALVSVDKSKMVYKTEWSMNFDAKIRENINNGNRHEESKLKLKYLEWNKLGIKKF